MARNYTLLGVPRCKRQSMSWQKQGCCVEVQRLVCQQLEVWFLTKGSIMQAVPALKSPVTGVGPQGLQMIDDFQTPPLTGAVQDRDPSMVLSHGVTPCLQKVPEGTHVTALSSALQCCVASHIHQLDIGSCLNQPLNHLHHKQNEKDNDGIYVTLIRRTKKWYQRHDKQLPIRA